MFKPVSTLLSALFLAALLALPGHSVYAQDESVILGDEVPTVEETDTTVRIKPVRTDSPKETLTTFYRLRSELETVLQEYAVRRTSDGLQQILVRGAQLRALIDLTAVAEASREETGDDIVANLLDIFGRITPPNLDDVPDSEAFDESETAQYRIPGTPLRISRIDEGSREGEFLFNNRTATVAPRFLLGIEDLPLQSELGIRSWSTSLPQITGPLIPAAVVGAMPLSLRALWLDTPAWKVLAIGIVAVLAVFLVIALNRLLSRCVPDTAVGSLIYNLGRPVLIILVVLILIPFVDAQINTSGRFSTIVGTATTIIMYISAAWIFWAGSRLFIERVIRSPRVNEESLDANLLRLMAGAIGGIGAIIILAYGGQALGLPVFSIVAGLGIGGLAVALAIRPTLENLIGGVILYVDKPVRVGDFCTFGDRTGTVESIGIRSTQLRGLDRTLVAVPNAQFADMQITNWARCDEMLIQETIGLRYETTADQLRYFLANLRSMLHAHPRINSNTVRVRFSGYGDSALNITIRVYAKTREWNDFHAIREDIYLRIYDLVNEAGSGFAFPSQTLYMGRDDGIDTEKAKLAAERVKRWRRTGQLPFPRFTPEKLAKIEDSLDYPPRGSYEAGNEDLEIAAGEERLSIDTPAKIDTPPKTEQ